MFRLSAQWTDVSDDPDDASGVDNDLLGGRVIKDLNIHFLRLSQRIIGKDREARRSEGERMCLSFNLGLNECLKQAQE